MVAIDHKIFGLIDPRTNELRYIGATSGQIERRLISDCCSARNRVGYSKTADWLREVMGSGAMPACVLIEDNKQTETVDAKAFWIAYFRMIGANLLNERTGENRKIEPKNHRLRWDARHGRYCEMVGGVLTAVSPERLAGRRLKRKP